MSDFSNRGRSRTHSHFVPLAGTIVAFTPAIAKAYLVREQFWGRAVRASRDSLESGALLNFWEHFGSLLGSGERKHNSTHLRV